MHLWKKINYCWNILNFGWSYHSCRRSANQVAHLLAHLHFPTLKQFSGITCPFMLLQLAGLTSCSICMTHRKNRQRQQLHQALVSWEGQFRQQLLQWAFQDHLRCLIQEQEKMRGSKWWREGDPHTAAGEHKTTPHPGDHHQAIAVDSPDQHVFFFFLGEWSAC